MILKENRKKGTYSCVSRELRVELGGAGREADKENTLYEIIKKIMKLLVIEESVKSVI